MPILGLQVGTSGKFTLKAPFAKLLQQVSLDGDESIDLLYTVVAKESIAASVTSGSAVLDDIYIANGLTEKEYQRDFIAKVNIITLGSTGYAQVRVPESYLESWPELNIVPYYQPVLVMPLGPWAKDTDFTLLIKKVAAAVSDTVGIEDTDGCQVHGLEIAGIVTLELHEQIKRKREALIKNRVTDHAEVIRLRGELDVALKEIVALQSLLA